VIERSLSGIQFEPAMAQDGGMADQSPDSARGKLGAAPGLCGTCVHAKLNETQRGTAYLRCTRAAWDARLPRYPRLPVTACPGFEAQGLRVLRIRADGAMPARLTGGMQCSDFCC
jgi:hypothetical protein